MDCGKICEELGILGSKLSRGQGVSVQKKTSSQAAIMRTCTETPFVARAQLRVGGIVSGVVVAHLLFHGATEAMETAPARRTAAELGFSAHEIAWIGILLLVCPLLYALPRTSAPGAILLRGQFGDATAVRLRAGSPAPATLFPFILGVIVWAGFFLREGRLRALLPVQTRDRRWTGAR